MKKEKRLSIGIIIFVLLLLMPLIILLGMYLSLFITTIKKNTTVTPYDFPDSLWISDNPKMSVYIPEHNYGDNVEVYYMDNNASHRLTVLIDLSSITAYDYNQVKEKGHIGTGVDILLSADAKCYTDRYVLKIKTDLIWEGKYKEIVLYRHLNEVETD